MRELGLQAHRKPKRRINTTDSAHPFPRYPNLVEPLYQEAIAIYEVAGAATHPYVELFLRNHAIVLWRLKCCAEAQRALTRAESLRIAREGVRISDEQLGKPLTATPVHL